MNKGSKVKLLMTNISGRGGISQNAYQLSQALSTHGAEVVFAVPTTYELDGQDHPFPVKKIFEPLYDKKEAWRKAISHVRNLSALKRELSANPVDICHLHEVKLPWFDLQVVRWCHRRGVKVVYTAHDIYHPERKNLGNTSARFYREVNAIIANAAENKQQILKYFSINDKKIDVIIPGTLLQYTGNAAPLSPDLKAKARRHLGLPEDIPAILFFGYIREYKGLQVLLDAFFQLHREGESLNLIIAGESAEPFGRYQKVIDASSYSDAVQTFLQYIPENEVSDYFLAADVVVLPYRRIFQSGIVHVAYAHARPIIASDVGGLNEVIEEGRSGFLVPPANPGKLASRIKTLIHDNELRSNMGERAYHLSQEKYSWCGIAEKTLEVYRSLLS